MTVTDIKKSVHSKSKSDIYSYGEFLFSLYNTDIKKLSISVGKDIENSDEIEKVIKKNAMNDALRLIARADYPSKLIYEKLKFKRYSEEIATDVVNELTEKGYIDDFAYGEKFVKSAFRAGKKGKAYVEAELIRRGIDREVAEKLINENYNSEGLYSLAEKKLQSISKGEVPTYNDFMKLKGYLMRQGYSYDEIASAIDRIKEI